MNCTVKKIQSCEIVNSTFRGRTVSFIRDISNDIFYALVKSSNIGLITRLEGQINESNVYFSFNNISNLKFGKYTIEYWGEFDGLGKEPFLVEEFNVVTSEQSAQSSCCNTSETFTLEIKDITIPISLDFSVVNIYNNGGSSSWGSIGGNIENQTDLQEKFDNYVPYEGANKDINISNKKIISYSQNFSTSIYNIDEYLFLECINELNNEYTCLIFDALNGDFIFKTNVENSGGLISATDFSNIKPENLNYFAQRQYVHNVAETKQDKLNADVLGIVLDNELSIKMTPSADDEVVILDSITGEAATVKFSSFGGTVDLSNYYTKTESDSRFKSINYNPTISDILTNGNTTTLGATFGNLTSNYYQLNTSATNSYGLGKFYWDADERTFVFGLENGVNAQLGEDNRVGKAYSAISNGQLVMYRTSQGGHTIFEPANFATLVNRPDTLIGMATQDIAINAFGYVTVSGKVNDINTSTFSDGDTLYFGSSNTITNVQPSGSYFIIGRVDRAHATQGRISVNIYFHKQLEISDINNLTSSLANKADKGLNIKVTTPSNWVTGTLSETEVLKIEIPPNTLYISDILKVVFLHISKIGANAFLQIRGKLSESATMPSGTTDQIFQWNTASSGSKIIGISRNYKIYNGNIEGFPFTENSATDITANINNTYSAKPFNRSVTNYFYLSLALLNINDQARLESIQITNN